MTKEIEENLRKQLNKFKNKYDVILGMSGGVDSTYSLMQLIDKKKKVLGIYLDLFEDDKKTSDENAKKAQKLANKFNIDFLVIHEKEYFKEKVQEYFAKTYLEGKTPNPCCICNRDVKMAILFEISNILNVKHIATGHYAGIAKFNDHLVIKKGKEPRKEQSYFLALIDKEFLKKIIFPMQDVEDKEKIRAKLIKQNIMDLESSSDSQDICFIQNGKHIEFVEKYLKEKEIDKKNTNIFLPNGKITNGKYIFSYTIGQRKGIGVSYDKPLYVKDIIKNENNNGKDKIVLDTKENMYEEFVYIEDINLFIPEKEIPENIKVKLRYSKTEIDAKIKFINKDLAKIIFEKKQIKGAKGQIAAIYFENLLLGGGIIK